MSLQHFYVRNSFITKLVVLLLCFTGFGILSIMIGQDSNWDLRNYHFYNPYAFLHNRLQFDYAPAQVQSFYNPLLDIPFYFMVTNLPPIMVGFILGGLHGLNFLLIFQISRCLVQESIPSLRPYQTVLAAAVAALSGIYGPIVGSEHGTTMNDNFISLFVLLALWLLLTWWKRRKSSIKKMHTLLLVMSGTIMGAGVGLKLTTAVFAIGIATALPFLGFEWKQCFKHTSIWCLSACGGFLLTMGHWMLKLQTTFQNPFYPYFNAIFKSPFYLAENYVDERWLLKTLGDALLYPFQFVRVQKIAMESSFRDIRFALVYVLIIVSAIVYLYRKILNSRRHRSPYAWHTGIPGQNLRVLTATVVFFIVSWAVWLKMSGYYRYLVPLELLAPILILLLTKYIIRRTFVWLIIVCVLLSTQAILMKPAYWGRINWSESFFGVDVPKLAHPQNTMVLMLRDDPLAYVIPFFPPEVRFVKIQSNFQQIGQADRLQTEMRQLLKEHNGQVYLLTRNGRVNEDIEIVRKYDCRKGEGETYNIPTRMDSDLLLCPLYKIHDRRYENSKFL